MQQMNNTLSPGCLKRAKKWKRSRRWDMYGCSVTILINFQMLDQPTPFFKYDHVPYLAYTISEWDNAPVPRYCNFIATEAIGNQNNQLGMGRACGELHGMLTNVTMYNLQLLCQNSFDPHTGANDSSAVFQPQLIVCAQLVDDEHKPISIDASAKKVIQRKEQALIGMLKSWALHLTKQDEHCKSNSVQKSPCSNFCSALLYCICQLCSHAPNAAQNRASLALYGCGFQCVFQFRRSCLRVRIYSCCSWALQYINDTTKHAAKLSAPRNLQ